MYAVVKNAITHTLKTLLLSAPYGFWLCFYAKTDNQHIQLFLWAHLYFIGIGNQLSAKLQGITPRNKV